MIDVDEIHDELPVIEDYGTRHPDEYAGAYVERTPPARVHVGFTGRLKEHRAELATEFPYRRWLSVFEARHSLRELEHARERLRLDHDFLRELGLRTGAFGLAVPENCIWIEVWRPEPHHGVALTERYGPCVKIIDVSEGRRVPVQVLDIRCIDQACLKIRYVTGGDREVSTADLWREGDVWMARLFAEVAPWVNVLERNRQVRELTVHVAAAEDSGGRGSPVTRG